MLKKIITNSIFKAVVHHGSSNNISKYLFFAICLTGSILTLIGTVKNYTNIPFWDMWDGYLGFYTNVKQGNVYSWVSLHNEHRILLSRIFFWIDLELLNGSLWFLIFTNFLIQIVVCAIFVVLIKKINIDCFPTETKCIVVLLLFSWLQFDNFTWGFQSQFFLAQLIPLASFVLIVSAKTTSKLNEPMFIIACLMGCLSPLTMGSGIFALPLLVFYSTFYFSRSRTAILLALSTVVFLLYFSN